MKYMSRFFIVLMIIAGFQLSACGPQAAAKEEEKPAKLQPIEGTDLNRITLTEQAAERLGLETATVTTEQVDGAERLVMPYEALLYDPSGQAWVYVNVKPLVFMREQITVDSIQNGEVILSKGPEAGTKVVTLGATELFGSESEFEEE